VTAATALEPTGPPVFVLAGGGRTGSTLVQRLLISTGKIMIWGEHGGLLLDSLQRFVHGMREWNEHEGTRHLDRFMQLGWNAWIPNVNPANESFVEGARAALMQALAVPAARLGFARWGFKEIRYTGAAVGLLKALFPEAVIVVIVRHPEAALRSIKVAPWYRKDYDARPEIFLSRWAASSSSLAACASEFRRVLVLRYEDLMADPGNTIVALARHVGIDAQWFDPTALEARLRGPVDESAPFDERDHIALATADVRRAALALGYPLGECPAI
jgi:hypothetical protein